MTLAINNKHIIYYHTAAFQSMCLVQTYFMHPDCLVVKSRVCTMYLSPDTINQTRPQIYQPVKFLEGWVHYMPLGTRYTQLMAIIDFTHAAIAFVVTAYPALRIVPF